MPKQISPVVKIKGKIDGLNYFESQDGYMVQKSARFSKDRYLTSETYDLTRRNASEFGIAGKAGRLFHKAFNAEIGKAADSRVMSRICKAMLRVLQSDTTGSYGQRRVESGNMAFLEGFDFNLAVPYEAAVKVDAVATVARPTGLVAVSLPSYMPKEGIVAADGATHYSFFAAAAAIDFAGETVTAVQAETEDLPWVRTATAADSLELNLPAASPLPIFVVMGITFKKIVNTEVFRFSKKEAALQLIGISQPEPPL
ncbi:MAG: hypothetical protein J7621_18045 [Niastella sp.]|nr:hypothetical protein [Niastella sp.]